VRGAPAELTLEDHEDALVLAVRSTADLAPAPLLMELGEQASAVGVRLHSEAELAATLQALQAVGLELSEAQLQTLRSTLVSLSAVWHSDLRLLACLRTLRGLPVGEQRPALREAIIAAATRAGYRLFLHELLAIEPTPLLRRLLQSLTAFPAEAD
jgi:hypothetical protein